jgi:hypothetical protein
LGEDGIAMVANALVHNKVIRTLDLGYNSISSTGEQEYI